MTIKEIEEAIIEQLKSQISDLVIEPFPDDVRDYELLHPNGAILISYEGSNYTQPALEQQIRMLEFSAIIIVRNLRSHAGAYNTIDKVRQALTNDFTIMNSKIYTVSERFLFNEEDKWYFELRFIIPSVIYRGE